MKYSPAESPAPYLAGLLHVFGGAPVRQDIFDVGQIIESCEAYNANVRHPYFSIHFAIRSAVGVKAASRFWSSRSSG